jgi:hypothetical protein
MPPDPDPIVFTTSDEERSVIDELVREMLAAHPPVAGSLAMLPWACRHEALFESWYEKEVVHELGLPHGWFPAI